MPQIKVGKKYYMTQVWYMHINKGQSYHYLCFMKVNTIHRQLFGILKKFQVSLSWSHGPLIEEKQKDFQCHSVNIYNNNICILLVLYINIYIDIFHSPKSRLLCMEKDSYHYLCLNNWNMPWKKRPWRNQKSPKAIRKKKLKNITF